MHTACVDSEGNSYLVVHLWGGGAYECNMCGVMGRHSNSVPWYMEGFIKQLRRAAKLAAAPQEPQP